MEDKNIFIETLGTITKKEELVFFENPQNILAFETAHAYPGYNSIVPQDYDPNSIFLVTKEQYLTEDVFVHSQNIRKKVDFHFNSAIAYVDYQNKKYPAIRIKDLQNYSLIPRLIESYLEEGINFARKKGEKDMYTMIQVKKGFYLGLLENDSYKDLMDEQMYYFEIPDQLDWVTFEKITMDIKYNNPALNFDAALAMFYRAKSVVFAVRIYKEDVTLEELKYLREQFLKRV
jgi:hypothetical protein